MAIQLHTLRKEKDEFIRSLEATMEEKRSSYELQISVHTQEIRTLKTIQDALETKVTNLSTELTIRKDMENERNLSRQQWAIMN